MRTVCNKNKGILIFETKIPLFSLTYKTCSPDCLRPDDGNSSLYNLPDHLVNYIGMLSTLLLFIQINAEESNSIQHPHSTSTFNIHIHHPHPSFAFSNQQSKSTILTPSPNKLTKKWTSPSPGMCQTLTAYRKPQKKAHIEMTVLEHAPSGTTEALIRCGWHENWSDREEHITVTYFMSDDEWITEHIHR
jgi:hypothetical protein